MAAASVIFSHNESDEESSTDDSNFCPEELDPSNSVVKVISRKITARSVKGSDDGREKRIGRQSSAFPSPADKLK